MSYEEKTMSVLSRWMGGESLREASRLIVEMLLEARSDGYTEGHEMAVMENRVVEALSE